MPLNEHSAGNLTQSPFPHLWGFEKGQFTSLRQAEKSIRHSPFGHLFGFDLGHPLFSRSIVHSSFVKTHFPIVSQKIGTEAGQPLEFRQVFSFSEHSPDAHLGLSKIFK